MAPTRFETGSNSFLLRPKCFDDVVVCCQIRSFDQIDTVGNRYVRRRVFTEGYEWYGREYPHKEITAVYVVEGHRTVILTAIARYGRFEANYED